jgi:phosphatidylserine/phosphatidylglycerophosphate/cardiolipin synthase-like enzyme
MRRTTLSTSDTPSTDLHRARWITRVCLGVSMVAAYVVSAPLQAEASFNPASPRFQIVESVPEATIYGEPDVPRTAEVWQAMIRDAKTRIDIAAFYITDQPHSALTPVLDALVARVKAGVSVRLLVDQSFLAENAATVARLKAVPGIEVRVFPVTQLTGGVLHAKYMVVDGQRAFVGSQNWDWRAMDQIHEIGAYIADDRVAQTFDAAFDFDWSLADSQDLPKAQVGAMKALGFAPVTESDPVVINDTDGSPLVLYPAFSPPSLMPHGLTSEEPVLVRAIDSAQHALRVQVMTLSALRSYGPKGWWTAVDAALRDAAARGVDVRIIVADWALREPMQSYLKSLAALPHVTIKISRVPPSPKGFIPYARVEHAKYAVVDDRSVYIGTGNWEWSYFNNTVDASVFVQGTGPAQTLTRIFERDWNGPYVETLDLATHYSAPRNH